MTSSPDMFCSVIIPTVGREVLNRAVSSALAQDLPPDEFEIIVVNDSGKPLPEMAWHSSSQVRIIDTQQRERSVARNTGAAIARGAYFNFLDDDDWLLPGALMHLKQCVLDANGADWCYGIATLVNKADKPRAQLDPKLEGNCFAQIMAGEWIPLQASLISARAFFAVGGFRAGIEGAEDTNIGRWLALRGELVACPHVVAGIRMRPPGTTTNYDKTPDLSREAREEILNQPGVWERMRSSVNNGYWAGRMVRTYFTSAGLNLRRRNLSAAFSRLFWCLVAAIWSIRYWGARTFWDAIRSPHASSSYVRQEPAPANRAASYTASEMPKVEPERK